MKLLDKDGLTYYTNKVKEKLNAKENTSNKVTSISSSSTDTQYPSAKCVYDSQAIQDTKITNLENQVFGDETIEAENTSMTLDGTLKGQFNELDLKGNTSQTGTPTPSSPIPVNVVSGDNEINVCGKNLLNIDNWVKGRINNSTGLVEYANNTSSMTIGDDSISFVVSQAWNSGIASDFIPISTGDYVFKYAHNREITMCIDTYDNQKSRISRIGAYTQSSTPTTYTFTISDSNVKYIRIHFEVNTANIEYIVSEMQLEKGSTSSEYEPYQGNTYNIDLPVENLYNGEVSATNQRLSTSSGGGYAATGWSISSYVEVEPNKTYTISTQERIFCDEYDTNKVFIKGTAQTYGVTTPITITTSSTTNYIRFDFPSGNESLSMVELGSKPNSYTPYGTTPIELCKIGNYQDYFYKDSDKWYLHKEIGKATYNGTPSENWTLSGTTSSRTVFYTSDIFNIEAYASPNDMPNLMSDHFIPNTQQATWVEGNVSRRVGFDYIVVVMREGYTEETFRTWLASNNINIYYKYATPTDTEITDTNLLSQLNAIEQAQSKENQTNISQVNNDLPFIISASAFLNNINGKIGLLNKLTEV